MDLSFLTQRPTLPALSSVSYSGGPPPPLLLGGVRTTAWLEGGGGVATLRLTALQRQSRRQFSGDSVCDSLSLSITNIIRRTQLRVESIGGYLAMPQPGRGTAEAACVHSIASL